MSETTQNGGTAATAAGTSPAASSQQDPTQTQPANAGVVEPGSAGGNSGSSDGSNGAGGEGGRERPGRAEREIKSLKAQIKEYEALLGKQDDLSATLQQTKVSPSQVQLPDYSQMESVTPQQVQSDVLKAAEQLVDIKMGALAKGLEQKVTRKDAAGKALQDIERAKDRYKVLNENDEEHYNKELDERIGNSFLRMFKLDPTYSFDEHLAMFKPELEANTTASQGTTAGVGNRGTSANRSTASSRRSQKDISEMSLDELESHIHSLNGR